VAAVVGKRYSGKGIKIKRHATKVIRLPNRGLNNDGEGFIIIIIIFFFFLSAKIFLPTGRLLL
jgi:hypothetical protein